MAGLNSYANPNDSVIIVGAGVAGLFCALKAAPRPVILLCPKLTGDCASRWAQGGVAAAFGADDSPHKHLQDTIVSGAGRVKTKAAKILVTEVPGVVDELIRLGVDFDRDASGHLLRAKEAVHSKARILRAGGDQTGLALLWALISAVRTSRHITVLEQTIVEDLLVCDGRISGVLALCLDQQKRFTCLSSTTVLATGGCGALFAGSTNPRSSQGHGIAMAARAGAQIDDAEFVQFHPTALAHTTTPSPLISEAVRGEGAVLVNQLGERFMPDIHPLAELAPRDVVTRAIEAQHRQNRRVYLDATRVAKGRFPTRFPGIFAICQQHGINPEREKIPITPAAHYHMGGIATDLYGRSSIRGLFAVGEVACTGAHGANRLASNSLAEALVFSARAGCVVRHQSTTERTQLAPQPSSLLMLKPGPEPELNSLAALMMANCGVTRNQADLRFAVHALERRCRLAPTSGAFNASQAAYIIASSALKRRQSCGAHYRVDAPKQSSP